MRPSRLSRWLALLTVCVWVVWLSAADVPYLTGRVVDNANILSPEVRTRITDLLKAHEDATTNQVAVLTIPTIQPDSVEDFAVRVFENWKLGQRGKDNGVLVLVVPQDRKMRIEVGYGLEDTLTDGQAGDIIRNVMTSRFKSNDFDGGIEEGVKMVVAQLEGRGQIPGTPVSSSSGGGIRFNSPNLGIAERILMGCFIFGIIGLFTVIGVLTPGIGWFLYVFLIPFWAMFPIVIIGPRATVFLLATYAIGYPILKVMLGRTEWYKKAAAELKSKGHASVGGFTFSSGGSSSGGWSSGGGGSSFSGGGGSSGGGGASGSW